jgi:hypothetical protein
MEKAEAITLDEARELVGDAALWPRMRDFLWDFAPSIHVSWLEEKFGSLEVWKFGGEEKHPSNPLTIQSSPRVKRFILEALGVEPFFHDFPKDDWSRLALLDGATLLEIAKWLGALACAGELRRVTNGATVRELKTALRGVYPEVFGFTAYFRGLEVLKFGSLDGAKNVAAQVEENGHALLASVVEDLSPQLQLRLRLKLPAAIQASNLPTFQTSKHPNIQTSKHQLLQVLRKLLKLRFPEAYSLCCS